MAKKLTKEQHLNKVMNNADIKKGKGTDKETFYIRQGSVGNKVLGSIDYLNTQGYRFRVISHVRYQNL